MSSRQFNRCIAIMIVSILVGGWRIQRAGAQATQPAANGAAHSDIELGKPPKYPQLITPTIEGGLRDNHHGEMVTVQEMLFNPATRELSLAKSPRLYADSKIDSANYSTNLEIFDYLTTDRTPIGKIVLLSAKKRILISPNYVVSPTTAKPTPIDPASYRASVQFVKGEESSKPGTTVTVHRNADQPAAAADAEFTKISRKNDVITWNIEREGKIIKSGSFGFPIVATEPELVKYIIQLP